MSTASTDPREIEADLERERASLASTLDALSDRVSVDNLAKEALGYVKSQAGSYTHTIDHAVRANPIAVALIGAGVAWLLLGPRLRGGDDDDQRSTFMGHPEHDELPRWESEGGIPPEPMAVAYRPTHGEEDWSREAHGLRARASAALRRLEREARSYYGSARDFAAERASVLSTFTSDLKDRLAHGLDALPEGSRDRILAARERAYAAAIQAERLGRQTIRNPGRMMEEHPLVAGAVAFALGAAVAAALPRTDAEDRAFGAERDRLMDEAARLFAAEKDRALRIAGSLADEAKTVASETLGDVKSQAMGVLGDVKAQARGALEQAADKAVEAAGRIQDRAVEEVEGSRPRSEPASPVIG